MEARNVKDNGNGTLNMEINHPVYGWVPFTASPNDPEPHGRERYARALAGEYGAIAPGPTAAEILQTKREAAVLSPMQFKLSVDAAGYMPAVEAYLADPATPNAFKIMWNDASSFERLHPDLITAALDLGLTAENLDNLFGIV